MKRLLFLMLLPCVLFGQTTKPGSVGTTTDTAARDSVTTHRANIDTLFTKETLNAATRDSITAHRSAIDGKQASGTYLIPTDTTDMLKRADSTWLSSSLELSGYAPLASPTFTGTVTLPIALSGTLRATAGVVSATASDTVGLAAALAAKQASGTYLVPSDTSSLVARFAAKQAAGTYLIPSDTSSLVARFAAKQAAGTYLIPTDTSSLVGRFNLTKIADSLTSGTLPVARLAPSGVGAGAYTYPYSVTVDQYGRVTAAVTGNRPAFGDTILDRHADSTGLAEKTKAVLVYNQAQNKWEAEDAVKIGTDSLGIPVMVTSDSLYKLDSSAFAVAAINKTNLAPSYNAVAFGADPTGVADSRTHIQAAINAANAAGGGEVFLPKGTYKVTSAVRPVDTPLTSCLNLKSNVWLRGAGRNVTTIKMDSGLGQWQTVLINYNPLPSLGLGDSNIVISDLTIDGNGRENDQTTADTSNAGIVMTGVQNLTIQRVGVYDVSGTGTNGPQEGYDISIQFCNNVVIDDCDLIGGAESSTGVGVLVSMNVSVVNSRSFDHNVCNGFSDYFSHNVTYSNCFAWGNASSGFNSEYGDNILLVNCVSGGKSTYQSTKFLNADSAMGNLYGFSVLVTRGYVSFVNCSGTYNTYSGLHAGLGNDIHVTGGTWSNNGQWGISLLAIGDTVKNTISGGVFDNNDSGAVRYQNSFVTITPPSVGPIFIGPGTDSAFTTESAHITKYLRVDSVATFNDGVQVGALGTPGNVYTTLQTDSGYISYLRWLGGAGGSEIWSVHNYLGHLGFTNGWDRFTLYSTGGGRFYGNLDIDSTTSAAKFKSAPTAAVIDSFKVAASALNFYVGGTAYPTGSALFAEKVAYADTNSWLPTWTSVFAQNYLVAGDSTAFLAYVKSLIAGKQAAGTYLIPADSTTLKNALLKNADSTTIKNGIAATYLPLAGGTVTGTIVPNADGTLDLGSSVAGFDTIFAGDMQMSRLNIIGGPTVAGSGDGRIQIGGTFIGPNIQATSLYLYGGLNVFNKNENGWLGWAARNTSGSEVVMDLAYIGKISQSTNTGATVLDSIKVVGTDTLAVWVGGSRFIMLKNP